VIRVPGDKSISHRALMLAALADGRSRVGGLLGGGDVQSTARVLRALGCAVPPFTTAGETITIEGRGLRSLRAPQEPLDCGNSGTTARLMLGILAAHDFEATLTGDDSLRSRPMRRVTEPLARMGARVVACAEGGRLPLTVRGGALEAVAFDSPTSSAQVKSALLLAGLNAGVRVRVREPVLSRDHTERMLAARGVALQRFEDGGAVVELEPAHRLEPLDATVPADFSSAAFLLALALLTGREVQLEAVGVNPTRTGMLDVLRRMRAEVRREHERDAGGEPVADLGAGGAELRGTTIDGAEMPRLIDEIPVLAVLAARAHGETRVGGAAELRVKESDRIRTIVDNLRAIGAAAEELDDGLVVQGSDAPLAGRVRTHGDHRIAMAFGLLRAAGHDIEIDDPGAADVSFPGYWELIDAVAKGRAA
jgi:3-phosphoshikimate 1-carboxyvinyltransferase